MKIREILRVLDARLVWGEPLLEEEVATACASDMMSDVLAFSKEHTILLTGLINPQVLRTADMLDLKCLVFARGKIPTEEILAQAREQGLVVMTTRETAFTTCGLLYEAGLRGVPIQRLPFPRKTSEQRCLERR